MKKSLGRKKKKREDELKWKVVRKEQEEKKKKKKKEKEKERKEIEEIRRKLKEREEWEEGEMSKEKKANIKGLRKKWRSKLVKRSTRDPIDIENERDEVEKVALKMIQQAEEKMKVRLEEEYNGFCWKWDGPVNYLMEFAKKLKIYEKEWRA
jgi:hypothetical protein